MGKGLTIQASLAAMRTRGLTPVAAMAATASCIWPSGHGLSAVLLLVGSECGLEGDRTIDVSVLAVDAYPVHA